MEKESVFHHLVSDLSLDERKKLLENLNSQSISTEPLYSDEKESGEFDLNDWYEKMPWYMRLWYFFLSLLKSSSPEKIYEDKLIASAQQ